MLKKLNNILRYALLILFIGYYAGATLFNHPHTVDGKVIVHSHPFLPGDSKNPVNHQHSANNYILIQLLSEFSSTAVFGGLLFLSFFILINTFALTRRNRIPNPQALHCNGLRAPPSFS